MGGKSGEGQEQTIGYNYFIGFHLGVCLRGVKTLLALATDKKVFWSGEVTSNQTINIDKPNLFGGEPPEGQGGLSGYIDVLFGDSEQPVNTYIQNTLSSGQLVPAFRGIFSLVFKSFFIGNTATVKPIRVLLTGDPINDGWQTSLKTLTRPDVEYEEMNPAHIVRFLITDSEYGMGYSHETYIDDVSFSEAAQTLKNENFAMSIRWTSSKKFTDIFKDIAKHINAEIFQDPYTGKWRINLIREDDDISGAPVIDSSNCDLSKFKRTNSNGSVNSMTVEHYNIKTDDEKTVNQNDLSLVDRNGGRIISATNQYMFCTSASLARELCARDLREASTPLATITLTGVFPSVAESLLKGDPFKFTWPEEGCNESIFRVTSISIGSPTNKSVSIEAVEDIFAYGYVEQTDNTDNDWTPVATDPQPITVYKKDTVNYPLAAKFFSGIIADFLENEGMYIACERATNTDRGIYAWTRLNTVGSYEKSTSQDFAPWSDISVELDIVATELSYSSSSDLDTLGGQNYPFPLMGAIGDEIVSITGQDTVLNTITILRGCADTVPLVHTVGARLWVLDATQVSIAGDYTQADVLDVKLQAINANGVIEDIDTLPTINHTLTDRISAPINVANPSATNYDLSNVGASSSLTVAFRDKTAQAEILYSYYDPLEFELPPATSVYARFYRGSLSTLIREELILTWPFIYDYDDAQADKNLSSEILITFQCEEVNGPDSIRAISETLPLVFTV